MFTTVTQLAVAATYTWAAFFMWRATRTMRPEVRDFGWFLLIAIVSWIIWYIVLAFFGPLPRDPWGALNRSLHWPMALSIGLGARAMSRREQE